MQKDVKENVQQMLDYMLAALRETRAFGIDEYNSIVGLDLIDREEKTTEYGTHLRSGKFVRVRWYNNPNRDDGYYDICVEGNSAVATFLAVADFIRHKC